MTEAALKLAAEPSAKAVKFHDLGSKRVNRLLKFIAQLGNLGNRSVYDYTEGEREKIFAAIRKAVDAAEAKFKPKHQQDGFQF